MGNTTFDFAPDWQSQGQFQPTVSVASFGDGYEQRVSFGINSDKQKWTLKFEGRDNAEGVAINAFLKDRGGVDSFNWTPPGEAAPLKWVCRQWTAMPTKGTGQAQDGTLQAFWTINATFEQVYEP